MEQIHLSQLTEIGWFARVNGTFVSAELTPRIAFTDRGNGVRIDWFPHIHF